MRLVRSPGHRLKEPTGLHQLACQLAFFRRALDRSQQAGESRLILRAGVLLQSARQRQMLRFTLIGKPMRVGGEKRERAIRVTLVFRQMKGHPANGMP